MLSDAKRAARKILNEIGLSVPVDIYEVARKNGISIIQGKLDNGVSGLLVIQTGKVIIGINRDQSSTRQRFTVAHELGHYFLHRHKRELFVDSSSPVFFRDGDSSTGTAVQEVEANAFAAELLMPASVLRQCVTDHPNSSFDDSAIRRLAGKFGVSQQAITIRLTSLGLIKG